MAALKTSESGAHSGAEVVIPGARAGREGAILNVRFGIVVQRAGIITLVVITVLRLPANPRPTRVINARQLKH